MVATLKAVFNAMSLREEPQQLAMVKLLAATGSFGRLPETDILSDTQARAVLGAVTFNDAAQAVDWLHDATQRHFLRSPANAERADVRDHGVLVEKREQVMQLAAQTGLVDEIRPARKHYEHAVLFGAMEGGAIERIQHLKKLWDEGVRFDRIYVLGSDRPLDPQHEPSAKLLNTTAQSTETNMLLLNIGLMSRSWPAEMQQLPIISIRSPMKSDGSRANTRDTLEAFAQSRPQPGTALFISSQPHVRYQEAAVEAVELPGIAKETVGPAANAGRMKATVALDAVARRIDISLPKLRAKAVQEAEREAHINDVEMVDANEIVLDAKRFQYRRNADENGVTREHKKDGPFDPIIHGDMILLWEDKSGKRFVVDGHHRVNLVQEQFRQTGEHIALPARVLKEADGYSELDAKIVGAYKNFAHEKLPDLVDAARVFHEVLSGKVHQDMLPQLKLEGDYRVAYTAAQLSDLSFNLVEKGAVPVQVAAEIASRPNLSPRQQDAAMFDAAAALHAPEGQSWQARVGGPKPLFAAHPPAGAPTSAVERLTQQDNALGNKPISL